ncbi:MAG: hypothetical protein HYT12_02765 [Candidatus Liptonbacteria bacterium]|nr:hypothetical protein [Candidatus Liptonbacteria bacterium]
MSTLSIIFGWVGVVAILGAYYLVSTDKISSQSTRYQAINFFGAIGIAWNSFNQGAWPSVAVNIIWSVIAIVALYTIIKGNKSSPSQK